MLVGIVDYKMGNLASVSNALEKIGVKSKICFNPEEIKDFDKIILPGVGAFPDAMDHLKELSLIEPIVEFAKSGRDLLGICLGMQLLLERSCEFEKKEGLALIPGEVVKFDKDRLSKEEKIPQMGWNKIFQQNSPKIFRGLEDSFYLYFVHSYHALCEEKYIIGKTYYGYEFASAIRHENIYGIQPHPEKSHEIGLNILENFIKE